MALHTADSAGEESDLPEIAKGRIISIHGPVRLFGIVQDVGSWMLDGKGRERATMRVANASGHATECTLVRVQGTRAPVWVEDATGAILYAADKGETSLDVLWSGKAEVHKERTPAECRAALEMSELWKAAATICDPDGKKLCTIEYDMRTGDPLAVHPEPYENLSGLAEQMEERVYCTDAQGRITEESLTRGGARAEKRRYLVVTAMLYHGKDLLLQKRSPRKDLDPGMASASAHGVAKEVRFENGERVRNVGYAGLINLALEINEELRHGKGMKPFTVRFWQGTESELFAYAEANGLNDTDVVWIVHPSLYADAGYPLKEKGSKRTRLIASGHIFCNGRPPISTDPSEAEGHEWVRATAIVDAPGVTGDTQQTIDEETGRILEENPHLRAIQALFESGCMKKKGKGSGSEDTGEID